MNVYTIALGVDCSHCHVVGAWEKDDKPAKRVVMTMNHVVQDVNAQLFGGSAGESCVLYMPSRRRKAGEHSEVAEMVYF